VRARRFDIADLSWVVSGVGISRFPAPWRLFECAAKGPEQENSISIVTHDRADLNNLQRVNGVWSIGRHRPYLYLEKVLAYEGFERRELFLLVHSCFLVDRDGGGHLFLARSGTGKSTLARKMRGLMTGGNDETNILYRCGGALLVSSTPFYTIPKLKQAVINNITAPLKQVYLLHKATTGPSRIDDPVDPDALWRYLVEGQVSTPYTKKEYFAAYHRMMNDLCNTIPVRPFFHTLHDSPEQVAMVLRGAAS